MCKCDEVCVGNQSGLVHTKILMMAFVTKAMFEATQDWDLLGDDIGRSSNAISSESAPTGHDGTALSTVKRPARDASPTIVSRDDTVLRTFEWSVCDAVISSHKLWTLCAGLLREGLMVRMSTI